MPATYRYEYNSRWNAKLPRNDIKQLVHGMHCATEDDKVVAKVLDICSRSNIPRRMWPACKRYALCVHSEQKALYYTILRGAL